MNAAGTAPGGPFLPLAGVIVLAWEQAVALPMATRLLADLGAVIIRLEAHTRGVRRARHLVNDLAHNKTGLAVDLRQEAGQALVRALAARVDVVCENFTPRVKRQFGLTYERLREDRPDLIMLSLNGYGQTGPWSERPTYGPGIESASGQALSMGYDGAAPIRPGTIVYGDNISGFYAALAIVGALQRRKRTGAGSYIDLAMYEANAFHLGPSILRSSLTGQAEPRRGNSDPDALVQGVFASAGTEAWVAVTVQPQQAAALATVLGMKEQSPAAAVLHDALAAWAAARTSDEAAQRLQEAGIAASQVMHAKDLLLSPHLQARGAFTAIEHEQPVNGYRAHPHQGLPFAYAGHARPPLREAPAVGQDSRSVLQQILRLDSSEIDALIASGVVGETGAVVTTSPPNTTPVELPVSIAKRLERRLIAGYDSDPGAALGLDQR